MSSSDDDIQIIETSKAKPVKKAAAPKKASAAASSFKAASSSKLTPSKPEKTEAQKKAIAASMARRNDPSSGPANPGSKEIPIGKENCLAGLKFVFTGELDSLAREEAQELAKRYGGLVTGAPSGVTSFVVVGANAGPSKLEKIKKLKVPTLDEDGFLDLIRDRRGGKLDEKQLKKKKEEEDKIKRVAREMQDKEEQEEKERAKAEKAKAKGAAEPQAGGSKASSSKSVAKEPVKKPPPPSSSQLWTTKYAPTSMSQICGNKTTVEKLTEWLKKWNGNRKTGFKKPGKDALGTYKAILISGSPGIGKTTTAHLVAKLCGYEPLELNASDARSKKLIETGTNIDNQSVDGWMRGNAPTTTTGMNINGQTCLIFDEVDGMSGGDRGGVGAMNALIKKTKIPMILICNDKSTPKMKPFQSTCGMLGFRKPTVPDIRSRIMSIAFKEKIKISAPAVDQLIQGANSDIRQVLNMLSTWKLSKDEMSFDDGKDLAAANEKNTIMTPFTITEKLFGPYMFSQTNRLSLSQKMEYYFMDFSFMPLFVQENYTKHHFARTRDLGGPEKAMKDLELLEKAADSISEGDVMDRMIHGPDQQWSLLPNHAIMSTIRPAYFCYGAGNYGQGSWGPSFPGWMGNNSKQNKNYRLLNDIQIHMRLRTSANMAQVRQHYVPAFAAHIVDPIINQGSEAIDGTIDFMDEYFLSKDDWDAMVELGVGSRRDEDVLKKIPSATKAAFTRNYNKRDHPVAVHKAININFKKVTAAVKADQEDVIEEDEVLAEESEDEKEEDDFKTDKLIKDTASKKRKAPAATTKAAAKAPPKKRVKG